MSLMCLRCLQCPARVFLLVLAPGIAGSPPAFCPTTI